MLTAHSWGQKLAARRLLRQAGRAGRLFQGEAAQQRELAAAGAPDPLAAQESQTFAYPSGQKLAGMSNLLGSLLIWEVHSRGA